MKTNARLRLLRKTYRRLVLKRVKKYWAKHHSENTQLTGPDQHAQARSVRMTKDKVLLVMKKEKEGPGKYN